MPKPNRQTATTLSALAIAVIGAVFSLTGLTLGKILAALLGAAYAAWNVLLLRPGRTAAPANRQSTYLLIPAAVLVAAAAIPAFSPDIRAGILPPLLCALFLSLQAAAALKQKCHAALHIGLTVGLILKLIHDFRLWSVDPKVSDYCFCLFALLCTILSSLHHGGMQLSLGKRRMAAFLCLLGITLCGTAVGGSLSSTCFFLGCALYLLAFLTQLLTPLKKTSVPAPPAE